MAPARIPAIGQLAPEPGQAAPKRGRPRSEQADRAILQAASELLTERGLAGMSIEEVASRAGVGKTTIYRRWTSRGSLALDAFLAEFQAQQPLPDTGSLHDDLLAALRAWIRSVAATSAGPVLAGLIAEAQRDPVLAVTWRERVIERLRQQHRIMLDRAVARGEIPAETDYEVVLDLMFGAGYHRLLHGHQPLTDRFAQEVIRYVVAGLQHS
jgi:AcrR family transcriptional regulator